MDVKRPLPQSEFTTDVAPLPSAPPPTYDDACATASNVYRRFNIVFSVYFMDCYVERFARASCKIISEEACLLKWPHVYLLFIIIVVVIIIYTIVKLSFCVLSHEM